jgi:acyl-CoA synthetase (NDP forming)
VTFEALAASGGFDVLALVHDFPYRSLPSEVATALEVTRPLLDATRDRPDVLPVYVSLTAGEPTPEIKQVLDDEGGGAPLLRGAVAAFAAIAGLAAWERARDRRRRDGPRRATWPSLAADRTSWGYDQAATRPRMAAPAALPERESLDLMRTRRIAVVETVTAASVAEAVEAAAGLGYPVVVKVDAVGLAHKSEVGGVRIGLRDPAAVRQAADELLALTLPPGAVHRGLLVQRMAVPGVELLLGARRDAQFGPVVVIGLGGLLAEALDDVVLHLAPLTREEAAALPNRLRAARLLDGVRGLAPVDREGLADVLVRLGALMVEDQGMHEIDLNPLIGGVAVDALVVTAS